MNKLVSAVIGGVLCTSLAGAAQAFTYDRGSGDAELSAAAALLLAPGSVQTTGISSSSLAARLTSPSLDAGLFTVSDTSGSNSSAGVPVSPATFFKSGWTPFSAAAADQFLPLVFEYNEVGDAGELLDTSQAIVTTDPNIVINGSLTTTTQVINGSPIPFLDTDLFTISLVAGTTFSAQVTSVFDESYDPNNFTVGLYLFDSTGRGLGYNGDGTNFSFAVETTGDYYFGISDGLRFPLSDIEDPSNPTFIFPDAVPGETVAAQTDAPLVGWTNGQTDIEFSANYTVSLIPEPSIGGGLLALGGLSLAALGRKRKSSLKETL